MNYFKATEKYLYNYRAIKANIWFSLTWSLELYQQANARLYRQGQQESVIIHHLVAEGTIDERVMKALEDKKTGQDRMIEAVKARVKALKGGVRNDG